MSTQYPGLRKFCDDARAKGLFAKAVYEEARDQFGYSSDYQKFRVYFNSSRSSAKLKKSSLGAGLSRGEFLSKYDVETRMRECISKGIAQLINDNQIYDESEFRTQLCDSAPTNGFNQVASEPAFAKYRWMIKGKRFWSTPATKEWALTNVSGARED